MGFVASGAYALAARRCENIGKLAYGKFLTAALRQSTSGHGQELAASRPTAVAGDRPGGIVKDCPTPARVRATILPRGSWWAGVGQSSREETAGSC